MNRLFIFTCTLISICVGTARAGYVFFTVADAPKEGVDKLVYHTTIQDSPVAKGYYWADQANFVHGGHAIYIGLQPRANPADNRAVFSVFGKGAHGISDHTSNGADGGPGSSGRVAYPWVKEHRYALEMKLVQSDKCTADEQAWQGSVTDETTQKTTVIAMYAVPKDWGHLSRKSVFFTEYFIYNDAKYHGPHPATRPVEPYAKVLVEAPEAWADGKQLTAAISGSKLNDAKNEIVQKPSDSKATIESGLSAKASSAPAATAAEN